MLVSKILYAGLYLKLLVILLTNKGEYGSHTSIITDERHANCLISVTWTCVRMSIATQ